MLKLSKPVQLLLAVALLAIVYLALGEEPAVERRVKKPVTKGALTKEYADGITQEDVDAKFDPLNQVPKDAFQPLVKRSAGRDQFESNTSPDIIPAGFAGGESGWTFTGIVDTNGETEALLENKGNGGSVFLSVGETWKDLVVQAIGGSTLSIAGPDGKVRVIRLSEGDSVLPNVTVARGSEPMNPTLSGPIGGRLEITPSNRPDRSSRAEITNETR